MLRRLMLGMLLWGVAMEAKTAWADFIHEGFAYSAGASLVQQNGGTGFTGAGPAAVSTLFAMISSSMLRP
ncbi:hypothetical protein VN12_05015 [Pirellula sp. SH-Sr6A]|uniref:hypothetical protein n=1 Tax=Pirellula sp. SH-Sr6A TaxID=1632865 RepID=UPI00078D5AC5|nr:hypothetical protein [Pirellula sp. SH-Sr6A]AMV31457.1 hypothetical protein VN12_05015 [Pirellula sp. SH-Sr6A]